MNFLQKLYDMRDKKKADNGSERIVYVKDNCAANKCVAQKQHYILPSHRLFDHLLYKNVLGHHIGLYSFMFK